VTRCLMLVEGQSEEEFVKTHLRPYAHERAGLWIEPTVLCTSRVKNGPNFRGGVTTYGKVRKELHRLLPDSSAVVTTMIDYYGLPPDFPGHGDRPDGTATLKVQHVESAWSDDVARSNFVPFLMQHEFEAMLFCEPAAAAGVIPSHIAERMETIRIRCGGAEEINDGKETSPSHRVRGLWEDFDKVSDGPLALAEIGVDKIRAHCPHFNAWLIKLGIP
jgi:hypothetical protein